MIMRSHRPRSAHEEGHALRMTIGRLARAAAAPGWSRLTVRRAQVGGHALTSVTRDGLEIAAEGVGEPFQRLRELSHRADAGTWFTCELEFRPDGRGYTGRVDSWAPPFEDVPPAAALAELTLFPREDPPGWLLAALPTAAPVGLPVTYGERYERWRPDDRPPAPVLPISGELAYLPPSAMTARAFTHRHKHRQRLIFLSERAGEPEAGHLLLGSSAESYAVARHSGVTQEGVRSITLDGAVLRLALTADAADALRTEETFDVRLDLPPGTIAELRDTLSGILRPIPGAPELIGF
jgi:hypothetical protein